MKNKLINMNKLLIIYITLVLITSLSVSSATVSHKGEEITSGTLPSLRLSGSYTGITGVGNILAGTWQGSVISSTYIGSLPASQITSGTFADARIPSLAASKITSGTLADARIPSLAASKITSGTFVDARIPSGITRDSEVPGLVPTSYRGANAICSGTNNYQDGDGNCDSATTIVSAGGGGSGTLEIIYVTSDAYCAGGWVYSDVAECPAGYKRTGCSGWLNEECPANVKCEYYGAFTWGSGCRSKGWGIDGTSCMYANIYCAKII